MLISTQPRDDATSSTIRGNSSSMSRVEVIRCANFCRRTSSARFSAGGSGRGGLKKPKSVNGVVDTTKSSCRSIATAYKIAGVRFQILFLFGLSFELRFEFASDLTLGFDVRLEAGCLRQLISSNRSRIRFSTPSLVGR